MPPVSNLDYQVPSPFDKHGSRVQHAFRRIKQASGSWPWELLGECPPPTWGQSLTEKLAGLVDNICRQDSLISIDELKNYLALQVGCDEKKGVLTNRIVDEAKSWIRRQQADRQSSITNGQSQIESQDQTRHETATPSPSPSPPTPTPTRKKQCQPNSVSRQPSQEQASKSPRANFQVLSGGDTEGSGKENRRGSNLVYSLDTPARTIKPSPPSTIKSCSPSKSQILDFIHGLAERHRDMSEVQTVHDLETGLSLAQIWSALEYVSSSNSVSTPRVDILRAIESNTELRALLRFYRTIIVEPTPGFLADPFLKPIRLKPTASRWENPFVWPTSLKSHWPKPSSHILPSSAGSVGYVEKRAPECLVSEDHTVSLGLSVIRHVLWYLQSSEQPTAVEIRQPQRQDFMYGMRKVVAKTTWDCV